MDDRLDGPQGPAPRARAERGNGLTAAAYTVLADIDPRLAGALLDVLAGSGVAAYAEPSLGSGGAYLERRLPGRPLHRLYVDVRLRAEALALLRGQGLVPMGRTGPDLGGGHVVEMGLEPESPTHPGGAQENSVSGDPLTAAGAGPGRDPAAGATGHPAGRASGAGGGLAAAEAAAFAALVARFGEDAPAADRPWPDAEDLPAPYRPQAGAPAGLPTVPVRPAARRPDLAPAPELEDDHYEPPAAPPVPRPSWAAGMSAVAVLLGVVALVAPLALGLDPTALTLLGCLFVVGGATGLVARLRDRPDDPDGDGAVV